MYLVSHLVQVDNDYPLLISFQTGKKELWKGPYCNA